MTEAEESERRQKEFNERTNLFMDALDVDEMVGQVLASEGFAAVEELAYVDLDEIASIDGFDEDTANEIQTRAREYLERIEAENDEKRKALGVADELKQIEGLNAQMLVALGEDGIKTIEDFAGCALTIWLAGANARTAKRRSSKACSRSSTSRAPKLKTWLSVPAFWPAGSPRKTSQPNRPPKRPRRRTPPNRNDPAPRGAGFRPGCWCRG